MTTVWSPALGAGRPLRREPMTFDAWMELPEDESGELVDGWLEEEEVPDAIHELTVSWLIVALTSWLGDRGFVLGSEAKLAVSESRGRKADVLVFLPQSPPPPRRGVVRQPPDIVVEVVTPTPRDERRDRVDKMSDYATFGVRAYWILDPALGTFEVFLLGEDSRYTKVVGCDGGILEDIPECPGLALDLDALWAKLERLGPETPA